MCGIFAHLGSKDSIIECLSGLKKLEYRGYDSSGIAGIQNGKLRTVKEPSKVASLEEKVKVKDLKLDLAIGHTRWATHGKPSLINAHPHMDHKENIALVHNGIIENYDQIRQMLEKRGVQFKSETDTEVIVELISFFYKKDLIKAISHALKTLKGSFALALIHKDHPDQIIACARECPLVIGYDEKKLNNMISSDPNAFLGKSLHVMYLKSDEIATIEHGKIEVFDRKLNIQVKKSEKLNGEFLPPSKEGFEHFMLKEIFEQPRTVKQALVGRYSEEFGTATFSDLNFTSKELLATNHILIIACGTSWHAGLIAASMLEEKARIPTQAEIASELRYKNPIISNETLVIAISQSGETADTIAAVREAKAKGAKVLGICNVRNSTLSRESDSCLYLHAGPEISVCSTKAFTSQIAVLTLFTLYMARLRHMSKEDGKNLISELKNVPDHIRTIFEQTENIQAIAAKYSHYKNFFFLGRRYMYATCLEAALKFKEISYINASGCPAGELKHGPIALIDNNYPVIAICTNNQTYEKMISSMMEVKARGAPILAIAFIGQTEVAKIADDVIWVPKVIDELATFPATIAGQLFAYYIAKELGCNIDQPRNLAKSVTVE